MNKSTLDILIDALSEQEWQELKNRADVKKAVTKADIFSAKRESAIQFGDWILKHNVIPGYDEDGSCCWVVPDGKGKVYTSLALFNIYQTGEWEMEDDDWDVTLNDGLEDLED
jgi:hypothetical protein